MGGAISGGIYGTLPDITLGGVNDITEKGRLIPTTSMVQYYATILKWFGVNESQITSLLPDIINFSQKDLGFTI
jgi:uncharacterized protein (DUF1501 family)